MKQLCSSAIFCAAICCVFPVSAANAETFSIAAVADVQYADTDPRGAREPREALQRLKHAIARWNQRKLDWAVSLGDHIDWDDIDYAKFPAETLTLEPINWKHTHQFLAVWNTLACPKHLVLGNHDYYVPHRDSDGLAKPASVLRAFGFKDKAYYEFAHKGFRFVVLDGDLSHLNVDAASPEYAQARAYYDAVEGPHRQPWNAGISQQQIEWLAGVLDRALQAREPVVLMCHYPIHKPLGHSLLNSEEMRAMLDRYPNVVLWLNGHNHAGSYALMGGRHHLNLKGMQNEADNWYQIDFSAEKITVYQAENLETPVHDLKISYVPGQGAGQ
jgi:calcineurin-like phosphoesterase family protein